MQNKLISFKVLCINMLMIMGILILSYAGYSSAKDLLKLTHLDTVIKLIQAHSTTDMLHDAIYGDVSNAFRLYTSKETKDFSEATKELNEHANLMEKTITETLSIETPKNINMMFLDAKGDLTNYVAKAKELLRMISASESDEKIKKTLNLEFLPLFKQLEERLEKTTEQIDAWANSIKDQAKKDEESGKASMLIAMILSMFLGLLVPFYIQRSVFKPIKSLIEVSQNLLLGQFSLTIPFKEKENEIGKIANLLEKLRLEMKESYRLKQMVEEMPLNIMVADPNDNFKIVYLNRMSKNTLHTIQPYINISADQVLGSSIDVFHKEPGSVRSYLSNTSNLPHHGKIRLGPEIIEQRITAIYDDMKNYIGAMLYWTVVTKNEKLADDFESSVGQASEKIASSAGNLEQRALALQGSIEELSIAAREISNRVHDSLKVVQDAVSKGDAARNHMTQLSDAAQNVSSVVTLIHSIAEKTNLLALNATIESARAGEAGKGFAVVANEVKNLASQTAKAITEINTQISDMQVYAKETFATVKDMCGIITAVNQIATDIASTVEEQRASTSEIVRSVGKATSEMNKDELQASTSVIAMASQLKNVSESLLKECEAFLTKVRSV